MSDEKQLTVAELLARSGKKAPTGGKSRPRRRRSLEDGGVSVAELTGSIPRVKAKPAEARHSNVPLDQDTEEVAQPAAPEKSAATAKTPAEKPAAKDAGTDTSAADTAAAEKPAAAPAKAQPAVTTDTTGARKVPAGKTPTQGAAASSGKPTAKSSVPAATPGATAAAERASRKPGAPETKDAELSAADKFAAAKAAATGSTTPGKSAEAENDKKSGSEKPQPPAAAAATAGTTAAAKTTPAAAVAADKAETGSKDPATRPGSKSGKAESAETTGKESVEPDKKLPSREDTQVIGAVEAAEPVRRGPVNTGATAGAQSAAAAVPTSLATGVGAALGADLTGEIPAVGETTPVEGSTPLANEDVDEEEEGISLVAVIALAVVGIILGVLVFLGFEHLWANFNRVAVGIAALVVTLGLMLGTRLLRTTNDGLSMTLAGAAGILMSFGPALIMYLT